MCYVFVGKYAIYIFLLIVVWGKHDLDIYIYIFSG